MNLSAYDFLATLPLWGLALFSLVPILAKALSRNKEPKPIFLILFAGFSFCFSLLTLYFIRFDDQEVLFSGLFMTDAVSWSASFIILTLALLALPLFLVKKGAVSSPRFFSEFIFLFMNSVLGLLLAVWSSHFASAFIAVEHLSLCFYLMIPMAKDGAVSIESGIKYFILGSVAACLFLLGIAFVYLSSGKLNFYEILPQSELLAKNGYVFLLGMAFILIGLLFKVSIFPFQFWLTDVYQGSSTALAGFMASAVKASLFVLLLKMMLFFGPSESHELLTLLKWLSVLTLLIGHTSALLQNNFKRLLIYSSIAHAGYLIMALFNMSLLSVSSLLYYLAVYGAVNLGAFIFVLIFEGGSTKGGEVSDLKGLYLKKPAYALLLTWFLLNLAGVPPSAGFFAKLFIFESLAEKEYWWLLLWAVLGGAVSLYYYLKPLVFMYGPPAENTNLIDSKWAGAVLWLCFFVSILLLLSPGLLYDWLSAFLKGV